MRSFAPRGVASPSTASVVARIATAAAAVPDHIAVVDGNPLTYSELERRSDQLAARLRTMGAGRDRCVGLYLERSSGFVVAALAILKSGAAYVPLDPSTPADRAAYILSDAEAIALVADAEKTKRFQTASAPWRVIDVEKRGPATFDNGSTAFEPDPDSLAYVIYTSGSTGAPKGVEITHANLCNLIDWHRRAFGVSASDRASLVASLGFDAAVWEIWPYLAAGASLHIADEVTRRSAETLRDWLIAERITIGFAPTILAEQLLHMPWPRETALRTLLTGGDTLHRRPPANLPFRLVNNYGPTECTVVATSGTVSPRENGQPTLGRPIANTRALILDEALRPVPAGDEGELCLGGALVGRGYRNRPELTASRFVTYIATSGESLRMYRTGDRARLLANGEIVFLGRVDDQVKIRGCRIELGEIIASLQQHCTDIEACTVSLRDLGGAPSLVAYVVPRDGVRLTSAALREALAPHLPDYMIPAHFVAVPALPVTANGKLDSSALPEPSDDNLLPSRADFDGRASTSTPLERDIGELVAALLGQPSIGIEENFFMVGGHSALAVQLVARIRDTFGVHLALRQLFTAPTVAALSAEVARLRGTASCESSSP
jgi:amino acid adenylation domain-containing protein